MTEVPESAEQERPGGELEPLPKHPGRGRGWRAGTGYVGRLKQLPLWPELAERIERNESCLVLAEWLATKQGFRCGSVRALAMALIAYRKTLPPGNGIPLTKHPAAVRRAAKDLVMADALLMELQRALRQQGAVIRRAREVIRRAMRELPSRQALADAVASAFADASRWRAGTSNRVAPAGRSRRTSTS